jgi:methylmalonyl-CoA carboxyltransferase large subunit
MLVAISCLVNYLSAQRTLKRASEDARKQLELRLDGLTGTIAELERRVAQLSRENIALAANARRAARSPVRLATNDVASNGVAAPVKSDEEEVSPEMLVVIAAAVTSFLGKTVRIRSAKMLQSPYEIVNPWAQQGRVTVQASHALRSWGRANEPRDRITPGVRH